MKAPSPHSSWSERPRRVMLSLLGLFLSSHGLAAQEGNGRAAAEEAGPTPPAADAGVAAAADPDGTADQKPATWSDKDTRLANHYLGLLQANPEFGNVLDLLWKQYDKHGQTDLLIAYVAEAANAEKGGVAALLHGHLLRKAGQLDAARQRYDEVLERYPENVPALLGSAEILEAREKPAKALAYYTRLAPLVAVGEELGARVRLRQAALLEEADRGDEAVEIWESLLEAFPEDLRLRREVVGLLLEAGRTEVAVRVLQELGASGDPELQVYALQELNRLFEFVNDFDRAAEVARAGMALAHYKHHLHGEFFARLVRLHERFGRLPQLEAELLSAVDAAPSKEAALFAAKEFYRLTAAFDKQELWLERLVELLPEAVVYRIELAQVQVENDHYDAAAATVDALFANASAPPLPLLLLRARIALHLEGKESASVILKSALAGREGDADARSRVVTFARAHYLDRLVEELLREEARQGRRRGEDEPAGAVQLARFLSERGKTQQAREALRDYVEAEGLDDRALASRLAEAAAACAELDFLDDGLAYAERAIAMDDERLEWRFLLAELQVEGRQIDEALATFQSLWERSEGLDAKSEVDQRMFTLLRGLAETQAQRPGDTLFGAPASSLDEWRRRQQEALRSPTLRGTRSGEEPPEKLKDFYSELLEAAAAPEASIADRFRASWWAFRMQDYREMYQQLTALHDPENPVIEAEKLLLELAEQTENTLLSARQLELLARIDPDNALDYRQRWAEIRFHLGYEDEAVRLLEELARHPEATLDTLKTLASVYEGQGRTQAQVEVWRSAYQRGDLYEQRRIIKQLTTTLIDLGEEDAALETHSDLISRETDPAQKRKHFENQLSLASRHYKLSKLRDDYSEFARQAPFDAFYPEALARIHRAMGNLDKAFEAMKRAYYMSGEDRELLIELGELASQSSDLKSAIYYRRQLVSLEDEEADVDSWKSLIRMLERDLRVNEADLIRRRLETKFTQDADFLKELSDYYLGSGQEAAASRVLEKLVQLRTWDAPALLELGLQYRDRGQPEAALEAFERVIEETTEAALPVSERTLEHLPVIRGGWYSGAGTKPDDAGLESLVVAIQQYRFLDPALQQRLVEWYRKSHPEFYRVPRDPVFLRLRAIEESGRLVRELGDEDALAMWRQRWDRSGEVNVTERLWALYHAGQHEAAHRVLKASMLPLLTPIEQLNYVLLSLRMGQHDEVLNWVQTGEASRASDFLEPGLFPVLASYMLLRESPDALPRASLQAVFENLRTTPVVLEHLATKLSIDGKAKASYAFGEVVADANPELVDADFHYHLSKIAHRLGDAEARERWLDATLERLDPHPTRGLPECFYFAVAEKRSLIQEPAAAEAFYRELTARYAQDPLVSDAVRLRARVLIDFAMENPAPGLDALMELSNRLAPGGLPDRVPRQGSGFGTGHWMNMESLLNDFAVKLPARASRGAFYRAFEPLSTDGRRDDSAESQFRQFEIARLAWLLEGRNAPERSRLLQFFAGDLADSNSRLELARTLEAHGFYREAIPLYRELHVLNPEDFTMIRGFLNACRQAIEFEPALAMLESFLSGAERRPSGMTDAYLLQQHAHFLYVARAEEDLQRFGHESPLVAARLDESLPGPEHHAIEYRRALARMYRDQKRPEEALKVYRHLRDLGVLSMENRLEAARVLAEREDHEAAIAWLEELPFERIQPRVEAEALALLASLHAAAETPDSERLADLARIAFEYDDSDLILTLADALYSAGLVSEAQSCLLMRSREVQNAEDRGRLLLALIQQELREGAPPAALADRLDAFLGTLQPEDAAASEWLEQVADVAENQREIWREALEAPLSGRCAPAVAALTRYLLGEGEDSLDPALWSEAGLDLAVGLLREDSPAALRSALQSRAQRALDLQAGAEALAARIRSFHLLGMEAAVRQAHRQLLVEPVGGTLNQRLWIDDEPTFARRWTLPALFADLGHPDLAAELFSAYTSALPRWKPEHAEYLGAHAAFLTEAERYTEADRLLRRAYGKALGLPPSLLVDLLDAWQRDANAAGALERYYLPSGLRVQMRELAERQEDRPPTGTERERGQPR